MDLAVRCMDGKYLEKVNITTMDDSDASSAVLAGLMAKYTNAKEAVLL